MSYDFGVTEAIMLADAVYGGSTAAAGTTAAEAAAASAASSGAAYGAGSGLLGGTGTAAGTAGLLDGTMYGMAAGAPEMLAAQAATPGAAAEAFQMADKVYGGADKMSEFQTYLDKSKTAFNKLGQTWNKLPAPIQSVVASQAMQGMAGQPQQQGQTNIRPPGQSGPPPGPANPFTNQPMPQVRPFAPTMGGPDDEEMKRRYMMMMRG